MYFTLNPLLWVCFFCCFFYRINTPDCFLLVILINTMSLKIYYYYLYLTVVNALFYMTDPDIYPLKKTFGKIFSVSWIHVVQNVPQSGDKY